MGAPQPYLFRRQNGKGRLGRDGDVMRSRLPVSFQRASNGLVDADAQSVFFRPIFDCCDALRWESCRSRSGMDDWRGGERGRSTFIVRGA